ncbi:MAG: TlyA family RNA methyltransferase [Candidatus Lokiarchaeota archaeon]|nr:TlyA family RNA methyltransferase [Candidatus Lokiarchaeota archaeon]
MKERIDIILVERRLVESRTKAQWLIINGFVKVDGKIIQKPGKKVENSLKVELEKDFPYVGKGGLKLEAALKEFSIIVDGKICMDVGASVGGFTDCLLKHGAKKVYAIDNATDMLHPSLRCEKNKERVVPMLGIDARNSINIQEKVDLCTIDITFASLKIILPQVKPVIKESGEIIALIKPFFEIENENDVKVNFKSKQDPPRLHQILIDLIQWCNNNQFFPIHLIKSPILGKEDSNEFFINLKLKDSGLKLDFNNLIKNATKEKDLNY